MTKNKGIKHASQSLRLASAVGSRCVNQPLIHCVQHVVISEPTATNKHDIPTQCSADNRSPTLQRVYKGVNLEIRVHHANTGRGSTPCGKIPRLL